MTAERCQRMRPGPLPGGGDASLEAVWSRCSHLAAYKMVRPVLVGFRVTGGADIYLCDECAAFVTGLGYRPLPFCCRA